jgi:hypothetical protein
VRQPDFEKDGWSLEDAEERQRRNPKTFIIPELELRQSLEPGDFAQLIFRIAIEDEDEADAFERMWVVVREHVAESYIGELNNEPAEISENDEFWLGSEVPFQARHIIDARPANEASIAMLDRPPSIPWRRD